MSSLDTYFEFDARGEALIVEFDQARRAQATIDVDAALADIPTEHQSRLIAELACIDLEHAYEQGQKVVVSPLLAKYPEVFQSVLLRNEVAKEHYRLCRLFGIQVSCAEVASRYGLGQVEWEELPDGTAHNERQTLAHFPAVGSEFCGYPLIAELGRGALARVYIARQPDLAERWVVLKITQQLNTEAEQLASLQHSGIIPVYSIHQDGKLYCICMPYLGAVTVADLLSDGRLFSHSKADKQQFMSTLIDHRWSTIVSTTRDHLQPMGDSPNGKLTKLGTVDSSVGLRALPIAVGKTDQEEFKELLGLSELADSLQQRYLNHDGVQSKVLLMRDLSEAIGYAHSRGIVHRDLKPENVLIANDGRPIVLDFNLATSTADVPAIIVGGTLPYMSPQQLRSVLGKDQSSPQDDVFALGVIFYQLLTGRLPFDDSQVPKGNWEAMAASHEMSLANCRSVDGSVPPSLNSIVMKCLSVGLEERYPSAIELNEDLQRFANHQVLRHAADRSPVERTTKFLKRHPMLTSMTSVIAISSLAIAGLTVGLILVQTKATRLEVSNLASQLNEELPETLAMLRTPGGEPELISDGIEQAHHILTKWKVVDNNQKFIASLQRLTATQRLETTRQLADLLYALAGAEAQLALHSTKGERTERLATAGMWNQWSAKLLPELADAVRLRKQKFNLLSQSAADPIAVPPTAEGPKTASVFARMLAARESGNTELWLQCAEQLVDQRPTDPTRWFSLATARFERGDMLRACEAFDFSAKLQKSSATSIFWRGFTRLQIADFAQAADDFSQCIKLRSNWLAPRYNRALAYRALRKYDLAIDDLNGIVAAGNGGPRVLSLRSQLHAAQGDRAAAIQDRTAAMNAAPRDSDDWVSLGVMKLDQAPEEALQDFSQALKISPRHVAAQMNTAYVQSEIHQDNAAAIGTLSTLIENGLGGTSAIASRGILQARSGAKQEALADAQVAAKGQPTPIEILQVAGIYALTSESPEDQQRALVWLARALAADPSLGKMAATDLDLVILRKLPAFRLLVALPVLDE